MTGLTRHKGLARGGPLRPMSAKKLAALGGFALSTFAPKLARTPRVMSRTSGVEESTGRDGVRGGRSSRGHRIERDSAAIVRERSGGVCEIQLDGCWGRASEKSHRIARGMGGRHGVAKKLSDRPSDLLDSCLFCHLVITRYPWRVDAKGNGWVLVDGQEPTQEPVNRRGEWGYLTDDGRFVPYEEACA